MRIRIDLKIFIFALIFLFTHQIKMYSVLMVFALIHELGHLVVGILLGFKPEKIEVMPYGLAIGFKANYNDINKKIKCGNLLSIKKIIIACAGPITNFILVVTFSFFDINFLNIERELIIYSNFLIGLFNLIPIYPLDGGRIIKELIHINKGLEKSYDISQNISKTTICFLTAISSIIILYYKNIGIIFTLAYLWYLVIIENKKYEKKKEIYSRLIKIIE